MVNHLNGIRLKNLGKLQEYKRVTVSVEFKFYFVQLKQITLGAYIIVIYSLARVGNSYCNRWC